MLQYAVYYNHCLKRDKYIERTVDRRRYTINDFIVEFLGTTLNGSLVIGILFAISLANHEKELALYEYERDYLCSQSRYIVGYSIGGAYTMKTMYVSCEAENGRLHNFIRVPHVEKKYSETLLQTALYNDGGVFVGKFGLTYSPLAI
jgi:hypothetical protein